MQSGALPQGYLDDLRWALAAWHEEERRVQRAAAGRLLASPTHGQPITLSPGLSDDECDELAVRYGLRFPPDLRSVLQAFLPLRGTEFPDWRSDPEGELERTMEYLNDGIEFDIQQSGFWAPSWAPKPQRMSDALELARGCLRRAPCLIRIFGHRFLPSLPLAAGNPVFSVVQTDVIHYGNDLCDYFQREFHMPAPSGSRTEPRVIEFWTELVDLNGG